MILLASSYSSAISYTKQSEHENPNSAGAESKEQAFGSTCSPRQPTFLHSTDKELVQRWYDAMVDLSKKKMIALRRASPERRNSMYGVAAVKMMSATF